MVTNLTFLCFRKLQCIGLPFVDFLTKVRKDREDPGPPERKVVRVAIRKRRRLLRILTRTWPNVSNRIVPFPFAIRSDLVQNVSVFFN